MVSHALRAVSCSLSEGILRTFSVRGAFAARFFSRAMHGALAWPGLDAFLKTGKRAVFVKVGESRKKVLSKLLDISHYEIAHIAL